MSKIWCPEVDQIIIDMWGKASPEEIAEKINVWLNRHYSHLGYKSWSLTGRLGPVYAAKRLGLVDDNELERWIKHFKKRVHLNRVQREKVLKKYRQCMYCGSTENLTVDHIAPVRYGGTDDEKNLWVLCKSCNSKKNASGAKIGASAITKAPPAWRTRRLVDLSIKIKDASNEELRRIEKAPNRAARRALAHKLKTKK